jgi:hypothetical protein
MKDWQAQAQADWECEFRDLTPRYRKKQSVVHGSELHLDRGRRTELGTTTGLKFG